MKKLTNQSTATPKPYEPLTKGPHVAICVSILDIGPEESQFSAKLVDKVMFLFEITDELVDYNGVVQPKVTYAKIPYSAHPKSTLRQWLDAWCDTTDEDFDDGVDIIELCLGKPCIVNIIHEPRKNGGVFDKISNVSKILPGMQVDEPFNKLVAFSWPDYDPEVLPDYEVRNALERVKNLPDWYGCRDKIMKTRTFELFRAHASKGPTRQQIDKMRHRGGSGRFEQFSDLFGGDDEEA